MQISLSYLDLLEYFKDINENLFNSASIFLMCFDESVKYGIIEITEKNIKLAMMGIRDNCSHLIDIVKFNGNWYFSYIKSEENWEIN